MLVELHGASPTLCAVPRRGIGLGLAGAVTAANRGLVITHGETHSDNFIRSSDGLVLVDWDTVGLAPPERDLWHVATADGDELARYTDAWRHLTQSGWLEDS